MNDSEDSELEKEFKKSNMPTEPRKSIKIKGKIDKLPANWHAESGLPTNLDDYNLAI